MVLYIGVTKTYDEFEGGTGAYFASCGNFGGDCPIIKIRAASHISNGFIPETAVC